MFIELAYGGMSVSVADAAPVLLQACKLIFYVVQNRNSVLMCSVLVVGGCGYIPSTQATSTAHYHCTQAALSLSASLYSDPSRLPVLPLTSWGSAVQRFASVMDG